MGRFFAFCPYVIYVFLHVFSFQSGHIVLYYIIVKKRNLLSKNCSPKEDCTHA